MRKIVAGCFIAAMLCGGGVDGMQVDLSSIGGVRTAVLSTGITDPVLTSHDIIGGLYDILKADDETTNEVRQL